MVLPPAGVKLHRIDLSLDKFLAELSAQKPMVMPMKPSDKAEIEWSLKDPNREAVRIAELVGKQEINEEIDATTDHAWLVVLGHFAQALSLVTDLAEVPLEQRKGPDETKPQTKLIEFLVGILGGIEYLQDLNKGSQPIAKDQPLAQAWGQAIFRHYSQVSRTLEVADEETLAAVVEVLRTVSAPFIQAAVMEEVKQKGRLTIDVDLTGRLVSPTSSDYDEASFGWMDDGVSKGYQDALTSLVSERWQRLLLTLQRYSGRTLSAECLQAALKEVEAVLQVRPRRRVELVLARRQEMVVQIDQLQAQWERNQQEQRGLWTRIRAAQADIEQYQTEVSRLENEYQAKGWLERPHGRLAKMRRKLTSAQKRKARAWRDLTKLHHRADRLQQQISQPQEALLALDEWLAYLEADNMANPNPVSMVVRIDAGFSTGPNLAWLIEMGYTVLTKAHHNSSTDSLRRRLPAQPAWTQVGKNAEAIAMGDYYQNECPYPLQAMLVRYHLPGKFRYTTLFYYDHFPPPALPDWFKLYNARQTIEAGIKEEKSVFTLKRHLVRSPIGMQLQEQFALFGANFVRWAAAWVKDLLSQANQNFTKALGQVKTLVRVVSRTRARWVRNAVGNTLIFDESSPFAGTIISLSGLVAIQVPLRLFNFAPS
jgi:hypothetical protein